MTIGMDTTTVGCDTTDMRIVHRLFRREFRLLPGLVCSVKPGDLGRAGIVAGHADEQIDALHHHHAGEDDLIWPRLSQRAALDAELIAAMGQQHQHIASLLAAAQTQLQAWRHSATGVDLIETLETLSGRLDAHLDQEERYVLPLVERYLTAQEWAEVGRRGMASIPRRRRLVFLGCILEDADPAERREFLAAHVPVAARIAYRLIGRRQYRARDRQCAGRTAR